MKNCCICGIALGSQYHLTGKGYSCASCAERIAEEHLANLTELEREPLDEAPEFMDVPAFDRWVLKLAVQTLGQLSPAERIRMEKRQPLFLIPEQLSLQFKLLILQCMSKAEVNSQELQGSGRWGAHGQFWFERPVRFTSVKRAAFEAGLIQQPNEQRHTDDDE